MNRPAYLKKGDKIGIVASARKIQASDIAEALEYFTKWGLVSVLGENLFAEDHQFAGKDADRAKDLQNMLDDPEIKAIVFARGGYGTVRIIDQLNWNKFTQKPKWLVGFSDITVLHSHIHNNFGVETLHSLMPLNFPTASDEAISSLRKAIFGESLNYKISGHRLNREGLANAVIVGGNLSILQNLSATDSDLNTENKILFIEDLDEYYYHIDRMMQNLERSGKLKNLAGLIVGGMTEMHDNSIPFGMNAYEIIHNMVKDFSFPVCFGFPAGHFPDNRTLIFGRKLKLEIGSEVSLCFED